MAKSEARERLLIAAEALFTERGYAAVTVKDIARATGIHHASIYHHVQGGKHALFVEVMGRNMARHQRGIEAAIADADDLRGQLRGVAVWLLSQPPMDLLRFALSDMPAIRRDDPQSAQRLMTTAYTTLFTPLERILAQAAERGDVAHQNMGNVAGALISSIQGLHTIPDEYMEATREDMAFELIDVFLRGISTG